MPLWTLQLATAAKSFVDNPLIGSRRLNARGLHRARVRIADALCRNRRRRLAAKVRPEWRAAFDRDGYLLIRDVIEPDVFAGLRQSMLTYRGQAREMRQGDAITRRFAVNPAMLAEIPGLREFLSRPDIRALFHYVASFKIEPLHYLQTIVTHDGGLEQSIETGTDPQEVLHADSFHASLKAWLFLNPVAEDEAPFTYVPGSHRFDAKRLEWEHQRSLRDPTEIDRLSARGSPRISEDELVSLGLPSPVSLAVPANSLVVADMAGFHARGRSIRPVERVEIWSYSRRNPYLPWVGADLLSLPGIAERRVDMMWAFRDRFEKWMGQPWRKAGNQTAVG